MKRSLIKSVGVAAIILASSLAQAAVVELNMDDAQACRDQLNQVKHNAFIVIDCIPDCPYCQKYVATYEKVAELYPEVTFFTADVGKATDAVKQNCLQETGGAVIPRTKLILHNLKSANGDDIISNPLTTLSGNISVDELKAIAEDANLSGGTLPSGVTMVGVKH